MRLPCDLHVQVNGEQTFVLSKEALLPRCGRLLKEYKRALSAHKGGKEEGVMSVRMLLHDMPGGSRAFEMVARFCYRGGWLKMGPENVALLRCAAEYLEMSEEHGAGNLLRKTEAFLSTIAMWSWKDSLALLVSCESLLPYAEKAGIIQLCVDSLAVKAKSQHGCPSPNLSYLNSPYRISVSPNSKPSQVKSSWRSPKPHSNLTPSRGNRSPTLNRHSSCSCSPDPCCSALHPHWDSPSVQSNSKHNWWCEDMSSLSMYMMERMVMAMQAHCVDNKYISKVLLRYLEASLPLLGYSTLSIGSGKRGKDENILKEHAQRVQREVLETVVRLLHSLQWASAPVKSLFELRRVAMAMNASYACRQQLEEMIGSQLHKASLDNILIPRVNGRDRRSCIYDVDLVLRLVRLFLHGEAMDKRQTEPGQEGDFDPVREVELPYGCGGELGSFSSVPLKMVGILIDKYLSEIAPDSCLKASKFSELAEALPFNARDIYDGLYRALDIYLQAHPTISVHDVFQVCKAIDFEKLSFEACKHVMENPRIPARFSFRVLASQQEKLRVALGSGLPNSRRTSGEDGDACPPSATHYATVVKQNEELRSDLKSMHAKVNELERLCKGLRSQISQDVWLSC